MYLLKWKGYSEEENSWEPSSNLFCIGLLKDYSLKHNLISQSSGVTVTSSAVEQISSSPHSSSKSNAKANASQSSSSKSNAPVNCRSKSESTASQHSSSKPEASASKHSISKSEASATQYSSSESEAFDSRHSSSKFEANSKSISRRSSDISRQHSNSLSEDFSNQRSSSKSEASSRPSYKSQILKHLNNGAHKKAAQNSNLSNLLFGGLNEQVGSKKKDRGSRHVDCVTESGRGNSWCVQAVKMKKKVYKKNKSEVKKLVVSIPKELLTQSDVVSSSADCNHSGLAIEEAISQSTVEAMDVDTMAHRILCLNHDHTYFQLHEEEKAVPVTKTTSLLTPPPSAEPCDDLSFTSTPEPSLPSVYSVQISPPPSPSSPPSPSLQPSDLYDMAIERFDSDSCSQQMTDDCALGSPTSSSPLLSGDSYRLRLSSASSASDSSDLDVCGSDDATELTKNTDSLSEKLKSVLTNSNKARKRISSHNRLRSHSKNGSQFLRWRKGPVPLPRSFSKRHASSSPLKTKAAKMQYSECVLSEYLDTQMKGLTNGTTQVNGVTNGVTPLCSQKRLSLSLKGRSLGFEHRMRTKKLEKVLALSLTMSNNENHLKQVASEPVESSIPVLKEKLHEISHQTSLVYKEQLMNWQYELNKQRDGTDDIIYVENELDMVPPPSDFNYICSNIYSDGVPNPSSPDLSNSLCGCECYYLGRKCGPKSEYCCAHMAGFKFAYTPAGKVKVPPGTPIYECNAKCSCPSDCTNRIVQLGRKIPLCIFRTNGRGWGVKTIEPIKPNTFVTEYVGEVITNEEAERRGKKCDAQGITYLFDLDFEDENSAFTVDAAKYGNISHFFNHSVSL